MPCIQGNTKEDPEKLVRLVKIMYPRNLSFTINEAMIVPRSNRVVGASLRENPNLGEAGPCQRERRSTRFPAALSPNLDGCHQDR